MRGRGRKMSITDCPCGEIHTDEDMRSLAERIIGPQTVTGAEHHEVPTDEVIRCDCTDCPPSWCGGKGPAYRRERRRHWKESRWIGEWNVCTRCTKIPSLLNKNMYPDVDGVRRTGHVKWLVLPDADLSVFEKWDEDFSHYYPLCKCGCPQYGHYDF